MKRLLFFFLAIFILPSFAFSQRKALVKEYFTSKDDNKELMNLKKNLLNSYNIQLDYELLKFDQKGRLLEIAFSVDFRNGMKCSCGPVVVGRKREYGFYRDYDKKAKAPYGCGKIKRRP